MFLFLKKNISTITSLFPVVIFFGILMPDALKSEETSYHTFFKKLDSIDYTYAFQKNTNECLSRDIEELHAVFSPAADKMYRSFNLKKPASFHITIAQNERIFQQLTGKNGNTASVYDSNLDVIYFQNPMNLKKSLALDRIVNHELCHISISSARKNQGGELKRWLEESFCEEVASPGMHRSFKVNTTLRKYKTLNEFVNYLNENLLNHADRKERFMAYRLGGLWGRHLIEEFGREKILKWIIEPMTAGTMKEMEREYKIFYEEIINNPLYFSF